MKKHVSVATLVVASLIAVQVRAGVVNSSDVIIGGTSYRTFTDDTTSLVWLDLDNFWDGTTTYNTLTALLMGSGFHLATLADLEPLQLSIPAVPANFSSEVAIVGGNYVGHPHPGDDRALMWGIYEDGDSGDGISYAYKYSIDLSWHFLSNSVGANQLLSVVNPFSQDLGAWIVQDTYDVPEPTSMALFGLTAMTMGIGIRRRERKSGLTEDAQVG